MEIFFEFLLLSSSKYPFICLIEVDEIQRYPLKILMLIIFHSWLKFMDFNQSFKDLFDYYFLGLKKSIFLYLILLFKSYFNFCYLQRCLIHSSDAPPR